MLPVQWTQLGVPMGPEYPVPIPHLVPSSRSRLSVTLYTHMEAWPQRLGVSGRGFQLKVAMRLVFVLSVAPRPRRRIAGECGSVKTKFKATHSIALSICLSLAVALRSSAVVALQMSEASCRELGAFHMHLHDYHQ